MEPTTAAWLAALIDGEGSVMLTARRGGQTVAPKNWRPVVSVYNTDLRLMDALKERTGGGVVYTHTRQEQENHKKTAYSWRMRVSEIKTWLPELLPWLVCKREQSELLLEALALKTTLTPEKGRSLAQTIEQRDVVRARIAAVAVEISALNRKGRVVTTTVSPLPCL
jgi:hypothetical protein